MQHALHNHWFHVAIVILVVLDALIVMFELLLDVGAFSELIQTPIHVAENDKNDSFKFASADF